MAVAVSNTAAVAVLHFLGQIEGKTELSVSPHNSNLIEHSLLPGGTHFLVGVELEFEIESHLQVLNLLLHSKEVQEGTLGAHIPR